MEEAFFQILSKQSFIMVTLPRCIAPKDTRMDKTEELCSIEVPCSKRHVCRQDIPPS